jgi:hypothetical protein
MAGERVAVRSRGFVLAGVRVTKYDTLEDVIGKVIRAWRKKTPFRFSELAKEVESRFGVKVTFETHAPVAGSCGNVARAEYEYIIAHAGVQRFAYRVFNVVWVDDEKGDPVIAHYTRVEKVNQPA